jgi:hypothetical protein
MPRYGIHDTLYIGVMLQVKEERERLRAVEAMIAREREKAEALQLAKSKEAERMIQELEVGIVMGSTDIELLKC